MVATTSRLDRQSAWKPAIWSGLEHVDDYYSDLQAPRRSSGGHGPPLRSNLDMVEDLNAAAGAASASAASSRAGPMSSSSCRWQARLRQRQPFRLRLVISGDGQEVALSVETA